MHFVFQTFNFQMFNNCWNLGGLFGQTAPSSTPSLFGSSAPKPANSLFGSTATQPGEYLYSRFLKISGEGKGKLNRQVKLLVFYSIWFYATSNKW